MPIHTVACVVVNYNGKARTLACLQALLSLHQQPDAVFVVDNGSAASEPHELFQDWTDLYQSKGQPAPILLEATTPLPPGNAFFLPLKENLGFSAGNNAAIRILLASKQYDAVWLLNNDTLPQREALQALVDNMNADPTVGMVGSTLVYPHTQHLQTMGGCSFNKFTGITRYIGANTPIAKLNSLRPEGDCTQLHMITGASCLVRMEGIQQVGLLDEAFFLYFEDTDWSLRFHQQGYKLTWAPQSIVVHEEGGSTTPSVDPQSTHNRPYCAMIDYLSYRNRLYLIEKHYPKHTWIVLLSFVYAFFKRMLRGEMKKAHVVVKAGLAALKGHMGKPSL